MSGSWAKGSTRAWRKVRAQVLARDGYQCKIKLPGVCVGVADCVHHTKGRAITGDDPAHMVAACMACNLKIGDPNRKPDPQPRPVTRW